MPTQTTCISPWYQQENKRRDISRSVYLEDRWISLNHPNDQEGETKRGEEEEEKESSAGHNRSQLSVEQNNVMWSRHIVVFTLFTFAIFDSQCHVIHKRGLISKLFGGGSSNSNRDVESDLPPKERSKLRELLKNPIVISMLSAAVGMVVQQALASRNMGDVCEHQYVKMAHTASGFSPELQRVLTLLGCYGPRGSKGSTVKPGSGKFSTTPAYGAEDDDEMPNTDQDENNADADQLESGFTPEKESKMKQIISIVRGEKGAKRNFIKGLFGLNKKEKTFKPGHKLPSSSYKLDKDDANALKDLDKELEQYNKAFH